MPGVSNHRKVASQDNANPSLLLIRIPFQHTRFAKELERTYEGRRIAEGAMEGIGHCRLPARARIVRKERGTRTKGKLVHAPILRHGSAKAEKRTDAKRKPWREREGETYPGAKLTEGGSKETGAGAGDGDEDDDDDDSLQKSAMEC
jgi:hypothetical protein